MLDPQQANDVHLEVNEHEGTVLGVIARCQPLTRHQLRKEFERSPATSYNTSKGSLYPLVARMTERGFVSTESMPGGRKSELLRLTALGREALQRWILRAAPEQSASNDPLLLRLMSLGDVPHSERIRWIAEAKRSLLQEKSEIGDYYRRLSLPYCEIIQGTALAMVDAKLEWLDRLLIKIVDEQESSA